MSEPDAAVIKLRRAEVHIFEALRLRCILDRLQGRSFPKKSWKTILRKARSNAIGNVVLAQWEKIYLPEGAETPVENVFAKFLKIHIAKLDDAWLALESAERVLSGKSHSSLWWGHLHQLRLRVYATHWVPKNDWPVELPTALAFRKRRDDLAAVRKTYQAGWVASRADPYHAIRLVDYGCQAVNHLTKLKRTNPHDACRFVQERLKQHFESIDRRGLENSLLFKYRKRVEEHIEQFLKDFECEKSSALVSLYKPTGSRENASAP
jgi:hypothetical protein